MSNSEFQNIPLKKVTAETSWKIIVLIRPIPLNSCFTLSLSLYILLLLLYIIIIIYIYQQMPPFKTHYLKEQIIIFFSEALSMSEGGKE